MAQISAPARDEHADGQAKAVIAPGSFVTYVPGTPSPAMNGETQILRLPPLPGPWPVMPPLAGVAGRRRHPGRAGAGDQPRQPSR
jgi:hypothetical protein